MSVALFVNHHSSTPLTGTILAEDGTKMSSQKNISTLLLIGNTG
jgi:hypothetical protein